MKQLSTVMLVVLLFSGGKAWNECGKCSCCKTSTGNIKRCGYYDGYANFCLDGCIDGYFGNTCTHACSVNCLKCTYINSCSKCKDGHYGNVCTLCPDNCLNCSSRYECLTCKDGFYNDYNYNPYYKDCRFKCKGNCHCSSYNTCNACKEGFYDTNNNCQNKCKDNCKSCTSYNVCTECKEGFHNELYMDCRQSCHPQCTSCSSYSFCEVCKSGFFYTPFWRNGKEYRFCSQQCDITCKSCTSRYNCTECNNGYYFNSSDAKCYRCNNNCSSCSSYQICDDCIPGKYNSHFNDCRESCKKECKSCISRNTCTDCVTGRFGTSCEQYCAGGCVDGKCTSNGYCACKPGFDGDKCDFCEIGKYGKFCDKDCPAGCRDNDCDNHGNCYHCNAGFVGDKCDQCEVGKHSISCNIGCPSGCANNNCSRNGNCYSCKSGYYGNECNRSCSKGCESDICSQNGDCFYCKDGFHGRKCDLNCPPTCLACDTSTNCSACIERHWGNICQQCPTHCSNCSSKSTCSICNIGFHGKICNERCNKNCLDRGCDKSTGNCSNGCIAGFYGYLCNMKCSSNCLNTICGMILGECLHGCKAGYNGTKCIQSLELLKENDDNMSIVAGASAGGGVLVVVVILVIVVIILIKKRQRKNKQERIKTEDETMTYSVINETNNTAENNRSDDIETDRENTTDNVIQDSDLSTDNIYAKPIKPKRKTEAIKSLNRNSNEVTVNNPTYEKPDTSQTETVKTSKTSKPPIASKPAQKYDNNVIPKPSAMQPTSHISHIQNDAALEIEEDIDCLSSRSKSVFLEEQKAAELENADTYYNVAAVIKRKITLDKLPDFVAKKTKKDFVDEFQALPAMLIKPYVDSQKRENRSKNRYKGIYPYDDTRVVLKEGDSDYINASYIDGYNKNKAYIASIGPTYKYMGDMSAFWIMVWQENVGKIVMLTNLEEGGVPKCDLYWPEKEFSLMFDNIQVTCHTEENYADYTFRSFSVQKDSIKREIVQVHFTAWPDKGTPDDVTSLIEFRQKVNSTKTKLDGPILVHCSAGIGRTGTYIALDSITNEGEAEGAVDIYAFVRNMREQRVNMIQTAEQYQYLHNALVHTLTFDSKAVEAAMFNEYMKTHTEDHLGNMFEKLQASVEQRSDEEQEAVKRNKALVNKNRNGADIPGDRNRPRLFMAKTPGQSDYINAVYVNSFKNVNRFLIAQTPLPDTVEDFLTLIVQEKVSCVISMETMSSANKDAGIYCPADNQTLRKGAFTIKTERGDGTDQYLLKKMKISYKSKSGSEEIIVPHVQYTQWDNNKSIPEEPVKFVLFVKDMELKFSGTDTNRPMLVHCLTGAKKGGLFCVVSTLLEKTQIDQEVSVANTVRQIKYRRHLAIPDKEQYIFCHHCVNEYLRTFDIYSNFELKT